MDGYDFTDFADFWLGTTAANLGGPMDFINAAPGRTNLFAKMCSGSDRAKKRMLAGGREVIWNIIFKGGGTFQNLRTGEPRNYEQPQRLREARLRWKLSEAHMTISEVDFLFQENPPAAGSKGQFLVFTKVRDEKEALVAVDLWEGFEDNLGAVPVPEMESGTGKAPMSLFALVNEETNGLYPGFTTVHNIDPTDPEVAGNWEPARTTYANATVGAANNIIGAMSMMQRKLKFYVPPTSAQYWESDTFSKKAWYTSSQGQAMIENLLLNHQDRFVMGPQDPGYNAPQYRGIPIFYWEKLDTAPIYDDGSSGRTTEALADISGPRFYCFDFNSLGPVFHRNAYFKKRPVTSHHVTPDIFVGPVMSYYNVRCENRRNQGVISPSADITGLPAAA